MPTPKRSSAPAGSQSPWSSQARSRTALQRSWGRTRLLRGGSCEGSLRRVCVCLWPASRPVYCQPSIPLLFPAFHTVTHIQPEGFYLQRWGQEAWTGWSPATSGTDRLAAGSSSLHTALGLSPESTWGLCWQLGRWCNRVLPGEHGNQGQDSNAGKTRVTLDTGLGAGPG